MRKESALSRLAKNLSSPGHDYRINTELFGTIDTARISRELDLENQGRERGEQNQPAASSTAPDDIEADIKETIDSSKKTAHELAENEIYTYNDRISSLNFDEQFTEIQRQGSEAVMEFRAMVSTNVAEMHVKRRRLQDVENEVNVFRNRNGLRDRTARMPSSLSQLLKVLLIVILLLIETVVNGNFLAQGSEQGLLGGVVYAFTIAFINIGFALIITFFGCRQMFHINVLKKLFGFLMLILFFGVAFSINLCLAHIREVGAESFEELGFKVMERIASAPFTFQDIESWILFSVGVLFACIAALDILYYSDFYPGYTATQKKLDVAREQYNDEYSGSIGDIEDIKEDHIDAFNEISKGLTSRFQELDKIMASRKRIENLYKVHHKQLQTASDKLHAIYRDANIAARTRKTVPKRFKKTETVLEMDLSSGGIDTRKKNAIEKKIDATKKDLNKLIKSIEKEFITGMDAFRNIDTLYLEKDQSENVSKKTS